MGTIGSFDWFYPRGVIELDGDGNVTAINGHAPETRIKCELLRASGRLERVMTELDETGREVAKVSLDREQYKKRGARNPESVVKLRKNGWDLLGELMQKAAGEGETFEWTITAKERYGYAAANWTERVGDILDEACRVGTYTYFPVAHKLMHTYEKSGSRWTSVVDGVEPTKLKYLGDAADLTTLEQRLIELPLGDGKVSIRTVPTLKDGEPSLAMRGEKNDAVDKSFALETGVSTVQDRDLGKLTCAAAAWAEEKCGDLTWREALDALMTAYGWDLGQASSMLGGEAVMSREEAEEYRDAHKLEALFDAGSTAAELQAALGAGDSAYGFARGADGFTPILNEEDLLYACGHFPDEGIEPYMRKRLFRGVQGR